MDLRGASKQQVTEYQQALVDMGYNLGKFGPKGDGVDGMAGQKTRAALQQYEARFKKEHGRAPTLADLKKDAAEKKAKQEFNSKFYLRGNKAPLYANYKQKPAENKQQQNPQQPAGWGVTPLPAQPEKDAWTTSAFLNPYAWNNSQTQVPETQNKSTTLGAGMTYEQQMSAAGFGAMTTREMRDVHPDLIRLTVRAKEISAVDFEVNDGHRTVKEQQKHFKNGKTECDGVQNKSEHQRGYALDFVVIGADGKPTYANYEDYRKVADAYKQAATELGIPVEWGGDFKTKNGKPMMDGPHIELANPTPYTPPSENKKPAVKVATKTNNGAPRMG